MSLVFPPEPASVTVVDDFEDGDVAEYSGDLIDASVQTSVVNEGNEALALSTNGFSSIRSTTGLNAYPSAGDTFRVDVQISGSGDYIFGYGVQQETNRNDMYLVIADAGGDDLTLAERSGGNESTLASANATHSTGVWNQIEVQWGSSGTHTIRMLDDAGNELGKLSATDSTLTSGGVAFENAAGGETAYFDFVRIL